ncbi:M12 family metallopeptidase [Aquimarina sp. ERC-38]|uniref:M12 family metallopeptidase n=1 Tax=Aquimarina sp. ERC-38 TaxID=2949996 RepID=UPI0022458455|nr:M12 family metallopeptidase [Aquimarina sp. ERC-38]UZO80845.1 M12 family metallopeptidase [Aquimarina sp. ERC-38]
MKKTQLLKLTKVSLLSIGLFLTSCSNDENNEIPEEVGTEVKLVQKYFGDQLVMVTEGENGTWIADDMQFFKEQLSDNPVSSELEKAPDAVNTDKLALASYAVKWSNSTVVYRWGSLNSRLRSETKKAMNEWSSKTNIRFKERTNEATYVTIQETTRTCDGCGFATIGSRGSSGTLNLGKNASAALIAHEFGHTLGFLHEQTRPDRDDYVKVLFENIQQGKEGNFRKTNSALRTTKKFDMKSIMMYHPYAFTNKRGVPTIVDINTGKAYTGAQRTISPLDIEGTNKVYPRKTVDPNPDICRNVAEWVSGKTYNVGDRVTYRGSLYEADFNKWNRIGSCGQTEITDPCAGVASFQNGKSYATGEQVRYNGYVYTKLSRGWKQEGKCN